MHMWQASGRIDIESRLHPFAESILTRGNDLSSTIRIPLIENDSCRRPDAGHQESFIG